jgi:hypothetical protein
MFTYKLSRRVAATLAGILLPLVTLSSAAKAIPLGLYLFNTGVNNDNSKADPLVFPPLPIELKQAAQLQREADGRGWPRLAWCPAVSWS